MRVECLFTTEAIQTEERGIENDLKVRFVDDISLLTKVLEPGVKIKDANW